MELKEEELELEEEELELEEEELQEEELSLFAPFQSGDLQGSSVWKVISSAGPVLGIQLFHDLLDFGSLFCLVSYSSNIREPFVIFVKIKHK